MRPIRSPHDSRIVGTVPVHTVDDADAAIARAARAFDHTRRLPAHARHAVLQRVADAIARDRETLARGIVAEAGKTIRDARIETDRAALVFSLAADEARRQGGEYLPLDLNPASEGRFGVTRRVPRGPVAAITPFNFPLNLVAHKIAPAIACGAPVVLKPAEKTPLTALRLAALVRDAGWPEDALAVLTPEAPAPIGALLAADPRCPVLSFTGSDKVGWALKAAAPRKRVLLELGGNAAVGVLDDADLDFAAARCVAGAFANAGQVCISVQRIFVVRSRFDAFCERLVALTEALRPGDPDDEATDLGPMATPDAADRIERLVDDARAAGARALTRGRRLSPTLLTPTVLTGTGDTLAVRADEAFGPVVAVEPVDGVEEMLAAMDHGRFGLQAGIFTRDLGAVWRAFDHLEVGALVVGDVPAYRIDHMPYGGERDSGFGREGVRDAIAEMTRPQLLVVNPR